jgi:ribonuclease HI
MSAELLALEEGLGIAKENEYNQVIVEGDSLLIIDMIKIIQRGTQFSKIVFNWRLEASLERVMKLMSNIPVIIPTHVKRSVNKLVDWLENEGINLQSDRWEEAWDPTPTNKMETTCQVLASNDWTHPYGVSGMREDDVLGLGTERMGEAGGINAHTSWQTHHRSENMIATNREKAEGIFTWDVTKNEDSR